MSLQPRILALAPIVFGLCFLPDAAAQAPPRWKAHDLRRPLPPMVSPAPQGLPAPPPSDAVVLFDGTDLSSWCGEDEGPATWSVDGGALVSGPKEEDLFTVRPFGDVQLHLEWSAPLPAKGEGQGRGNSGVFFMGLYEVQILDSFENTTYADGQAAAVYGQYPPLANACLPPGEWQTYDIAFRRPRFSPDGKLLSPARMTVIHNGILVQDAVELLGPTMWLQHLPYAPHPDQLPLSLQHHGNPVRFRNIWLRELAEHAEPGPAEQEQEEQPAIFLAPQKLDGFTGAYGNDPAARPSFLVQREGHQLCLVFGRKREAKVNLAPRSPTLFSMQWTAGSVEFDLDAGGSATAMTVHLAGSSFTVKRVP